MRKYTQAPHPFIFEPNPCGPESVKEGDRIRHSLVLIGEGIRYLPHLFLALEELGRQGLGREGVPFQIDNLTDGNGDVVFRREDGRRFRQTTYVQLRLEPGESRRARFRINLESPTRIVVEGRLSSVPTVEDIVTALCRRVFLLRHFHCGGSAEPLSAAFVETARAVRCLQHDLRWSEASRYSTRQERSVPIGGIVGSLECEGDVGRLQPLLRVGEYVHVGKNATFGLGKLALVEGAES